METKAIIILLIGITIPILIYFLPQIWETIKKIPKKKSGKINIIKSISGNNAISSSNTPKVKSKFWPKFAGTLGVIILVAVTVVIILLGIWLCKKVFTPKPKPLQYVTVLVEVRRKEINLHCKFNDADSIHMKYGETCSFNFASVAFCVQNSAGQIVCGPAYSDPDLPRGEANQDLWFKSKHGQLGKLLVIIYKRRLQLIQ